MSSNGKERDILVIDDSIMQAQIAEQALLKAGYRVRIGFSLGDARALLEERVPDLLLLDIILPDGDGIVFYEEARQSHPDMKVVIFTAYGNVQRAVTALRGGAANFIEKPVSEPQLVQALDDVLMNTQTQTG